MDIKLVKTAVTMMPATMRTVVEASWPPKRFSTASAMTLPPPDTSSPLAKPWGAARMTKVFQSISASVFFRGIQPLVIRTVAPIKATTATLM